MLSRFQLLMLVACLGLLVDATMATNRSRRRRRRSGSKGYPRPWLQIPLSPTNEVPTLLASGTGTALIRWSSKGTLQVRLSYYDVEGDILFAHFHIGRQAVNGPVALTICSNTDDAIANCPKSGYTGDFYITGDDVGDNSAIGLEAGDLKRLVKALKAGAAYVNVHSSLFPPGILRGQKGDEPVALY